MLPACPAETNRHKTKIDDVDSCFGFCACPVCVLEAAYRGEAYNRIIADQRTVVSIPPKASPGPCAKVEWPMPVICVVIYRPRSAALVHLSDLPLLARPRYLAQNPRISCSCESWLVRPCLCSRLHQCCGRDSSRLCWGSSSRR